MPEKLLTLRELSSYLGISEEKITLLVEEGVISAYKIGGEFLRFRREQIEAIYSEINSRINDSDRIPVSEARAKVQERHKMILDRSRSPNGDRFADFLYFHDFYIISGLLIIALLFVIFKV